MTEYHHLRTDVEREVLHVWLNRPDVHNAFNDELITEAIALFESLANGSAYRTVVLRGSGKSFCAGADLNWMSRMVTYTREENIRDSSALAKMFALIDECPLPVIGAIQGAAIGGGVGLVAACDIAIATSSAVFGLSEVKLGLIPSVISPYVIAKIGASHARALFLTGERFPAERAFRIGLIHEQVEDEQALDAAIARTIDQLRSSAPGAVAASKRLIAAVALTPLAESIPYTIEAISERRVSDEGQAGMSAFLGKKKAPWNE